MLQLTFYGDDFTGSTDVLESLNYFGLNSVLFTSPPAPEDIQLFRLKNQDYNSGKLQAFGVAGISRTLSCSQMDQHLPDIFEKISKIPSRYFHYKICSTFDSSLETGNIGHAVEIAQRYFPGSFLPLLVALPSLNRFCLFGNLFARVDTTTYRLDRHPTMSRHPVTPMDEADLRLHLGKQSKRPVHLIDLLHLENEDKATKMFQSFQASGGYILFDTLDEKDLIKIGNMIHRFSDKTQQLLVGSSAVEYALGHQWKRENTSSPKPAGKASAYIIISGSCAPNTMKQIQHVLSLGFVGIRMDMAALISKPDEEIRRCKLICLKVLNEGRVPVLFSALGPDDESIPLLRNVSKELPKNFLATCQGTIVKEVLEQTGKLRICVAGGDTSGAVMQTLGIRALELRTAIAPGAPLCLAHSDDPRFDGLEIALKGGQNGTERYFEFIRDGKTS